MARGARIGVRWIKWQRARNRNKNEINANARLQEGRTERAGAPTKTGTCPLLDAGRREDETALADRSEKKELKPELLSSFTV